MTRLKNELEKSRRVNFFNRWLLFKKLYTNLFRVLVFFLFIALCTVCHLDSLSNINKELYCDLKLNTTIKCKICFLLPLRSSYFMRFRMHYFFASTNVESFFFFDTWNLVKRFSYFSEQKFFLTYKTLFFSTSFDECLLFFRLLSPSPSWKILQIFHMSHFFNTFV